MVAMGWQRPGAGQEAERHSPCVALRRECTESAARWVRIILDRLHRIHIRSWLPLLHCSPSATRCAFRPFPPAQVCTSSAAGNINAAWHAQAEAARLSAPSQLESAAWRGASFHQSSGCSACALLERRRVASCAPPQQNISSILSSRSRPLLVLYKEAAGKKFSPYFQV